jgi:tetratricopeptide (TPR) repeat protein
MSDPSRIDDLRRRVQKDPASIAFAQLAEECRRAGAYEEAVSVARNGLATHPGYLSARVTLGRALIEINQLDEAEAELRQVLKSAAENLAAIRGLAEIEHRRGRLVEALAHYRSALTLARNDPDLEQTVADLARQIEPPLPKPGTGGLTLEHLTQELSLHVPPPKATAPAAAPEPAAPAVPIAPPAPAAPPVFDLLTTPDRESVRSPVVAPPSPAPSNRVDPPLAVAAPGPVDPPPDPERTRALKTIDALEGWLAAIDVARADRRA